MPRTFGKFELLSLVEEGIGGRLYHARDVEKNRKVLLKLVSASLSENPAFGRYFYHKWADKATMFEHPNVVSTVEVGKEGNTYYVALEEINGQRLSETLRKGRPRPEEALEIIRQVAEALRAAHRREIVHGDLKPSCIFLCKDKMGRSLVKVVLFDLGVAASESMVSVYGETVGTPKYMAPEVISGGLVTPQSDVFALGVIAYELLTGKEPFPSDHVVGYLSSNSLLQQRPVHEVNRDVPREAGMIVGRMLEKQPARRYKSVQKVIDDLDRCEQGIKTGQVTVVPMGTDSAFARDYELPEPGQEKRTAASRLSALNWVALLLAAVALVLALHGLFAAPATTALTGSEPGAPPAGTRRVTEVPPGPEAGATGMAAPSVAESKQRAMELAAKAALESASRDWDQYRRSRAYELAIAGFKKVAQEYGATPYRERALDMMAKIYTEWGLELLNDEKYEEAMEKLKRALTVAPEGSEFGALAKLKLPEVMAKSADFYYERALYQKALRIYQEIKENFPGTPEAALLAHKRPAIMLRQAYGKWKVEGLPEEALPMLQDIIADYPDTESAAEAERQIPPLYLDVANKRIEEGKLVEARTVLARIISGFPGSAAATSASDLEAQVLVKLYESARKNGDAKAASGYFEELVRTHPESSCALRAIKQNLSLTPQPGESMFTDSTARNKFREAESYFENFDFVRAITTLEDVARYTDIESPVCASALEKLPEWSYLSAVHTYGRGRKEEAEKDLQAAAATYFFSPWGKKAAAALKRIKNAPEGMVYVPEGRFYMGTDLEEIAALLRPYQPREVIEDKERLVDVARIHGFACEVPRHVANTGAYYIDKTEVTNKDYAEFIRATGHKPPPHWQNGSYAEGEGNNPVANVTFSDAEAYARWAGKRLPTEAEWEKAARGVDGRVYPWGDVFDRSYCNHMREQKVGVVPVGSYGLGVSPYGCLDMIGNVLEWTDGWFDAYDGSDKGDTLFGRTYRVLRGGAWYSDELAPIPTRCASRFPAKPQDRRAEVGFRCVRDFKGE